MNHDEAAGVTSRIRPRRSIRGISAILLPHTDGGNVDWSAYEDHVSRTLDAGLTPAVNMDTGFVQLLDPDTRDRALAVASDLSSGDFVAGAYVADRAGDGFDVGAHVRAATAVADRGGVPVLFPSQGLNSLDGEGWVAAHRSIAEDVDRFIAFELGPMFVPYGRIHSADVFAGVMEVQQCIGAKHSSLSRGAEWQRLELRDEHRPGFALFTGNDLAIDMVMYGSDYLLGLSTFAPDAFAVRDGLWERGDPSFHELNDLLQYLGRFTFRDPVPAYRHDAAMFLHMRGWAASDSVPAGVPRRPESDREVLADILAQLEAWL